MVDTLRFNGITCKNFLPYYSEKIIFPKQEGVLIINGNNGHGKSSLITAIRFVLFGKIGGSVANEEFTVLDLINKDGFDNGNYSCSVELDVDYLGKNYIITRSCSPKDKTRKPTAGVDYEAPKLYVTSENKVLSDKEQAKLLFKIMNENLARFYLFDGELLEEYKRVLSGNLQNLSFKIKNAIENLLGLPLLTNANDHLTEIKKELKGKYKAACLLEKGTQEQIAALENEERKLEKLKSDLKCWRDELDKYENIITQCKDERNRHEEDIDLLRQVDIDEYNIQRLNKHLDELTEKQEICLDEAWKILISQKINELSEKYTDQYQSLEAEKIKITAHNEIIEKLRASLSSERCMWCNQYIQDDATKTHINSEIEKFEKELSPSSDINKLNKKIESIVDIRRLIKEFEKSYNTSSLRNLIQNKQDIESDKVELAEYELDLKRLNEQRSSSLDKASLKKLEEMEGSAISKKANCMSTCQKLENDIKAQTEKIERHTALITALEYKAKNATLGQLNEQITKVNNLINLFEKGTDNYREKKRESVENSASKLYCELSEAAVGGLHISENYAVSYYDKYGNNLPKPSSGYSHLQAFALIGGLHQNMPIMGPLFMDTPSSRLDLANTTNLLRVIPKLSSQVILLITDKDFDTVELHNTINDYIIAEYDIEKISGTHSIIVEKKRGM